MTVDLTAIPEADLHREVARRKEEAERQRQERQQRRNDFAVAHVDLLLQIVPHSRTSCSDTRPYNGKGTHSSGGHRCDRCFLLDVKEDGIWPDGYTLSVSYPPHNFDDLTGQKNDQQ